MADLGLGLDLGLSCLSFVVLILYHVRLWILLWKSPHQTVIGINQQMRSKWVDMIVEKKKDVLAVQSIRNIMQGTTFLASTAIILALGIASVIFPAADDFTFSLDFHIFDESAKTLVKTKALILVLLYFLAFFNFTLTIRYLNHVTFMINVAFEDSEWLTAENVTKVFGLAMSHHSFGIRCYYISIPAAVWLFGPTYMTVSTIFVLILMTYADRPAFSKSIRTIRNQQGATLARCTHGDEESPSMQLRDMHKSVP